MTATIKQFTESVNLTEATLDETAHAIRGVILIEAGRSMNMVEYTPEVLQAAAPLFQDCAAFADHDWQPSILKTTGWYDNPVWVNTHLMADRYFTANEAGNDVWEIASAIVSGRAPKKLAGLSVNVFCRGDYRYDEVMQTDIFVPDQITYAMSVDDVAFPAAGGAYTEAANPVKRDLLASLAFEEWRDLQPKYTARLRRELASVRQTEALSKAQSDLKTANEQLATLQAAVQRLEGEHQQGQRAARAARRQVALEAALRAAELPAAYEADLRKRLPKLPQSEWLVVIKQEKAKAGTQRVPVMGVVTVQPPPVVVVPETGSRPLKHGVLNMEAFASPDEFYAYTQTLGVGNDR